MRSGNGWRKLLVIYMEKEIDNSNKQKLLFVYNADSGIINTVKDYFHKIVKLSTYQCNLCSLTFNNLGMINTWKEFINDLELDVEFLHKDEFENKYHLKNVQFPAGFLRKGSDIKPLISDNEINKCKTLDDLMALVSNKINEI